MLTLAEEGKPYAKITKITGMSKCEELVGDWALSQLEAD